MGPMLIQFRNKGNSTTSSVQNQGQGLGRDLYMAETQASALTSQYIISVPCHGSQQRAVRLLTANLPSGRGVTEHGDSGPWWPEQALVAPSN